MDRPISAHEPLGHSSGADTTPSERSFGFVFTGVLALMALWPVIRLGQPRYLVLLAAAALLGVTLWAPQLLRHPNRLWFRFGLLLHKVVSPIILGLIFFLTVVPTGFVMRLMGRDLLRVKRDDDATSYWITRSPPGPDSKSMTAQF